MSPARLVDRTPERIAREDDDAVAELLAALLIAGYRRRHPASATDAPPAAEPTR